MKAYVKIKRLVLDGKSIKICATEVNYFCLCNSKYTFLMYGESWDPLCKCACSTLEEGKCIAHVSSPTSLGEDRHVLISAASSLESPTTCPCSSAFIQTEHLQLEA